MYRAIRPMSRLSLMLGLVAALSVTLTLACEKAPSVPSPPIRPQPPVPPQAVTHTLTITASSSCTALPEVAKKRTYSAQVNEGSNGDLLVWVVNSTASMVGWGNDNGFTGKRDGNTVRFDIVDDLGAPYAMIERIPDVGDMGFYGTATGTIDSGGKILATFNGTYRLGWGDGPVLCEAPDHRIDIVPTGRSHASGSGAVVARGRIELPTP